ncbi:MAG: cyclopropane fatty acyl phospholipid synthase [Candidatus Hydrogenedentales bacterium]|jgi:cyclopropane-fatty-acyl-phospholipid synthase
MTAKHREETAPFQTSDARAVAHFLSRADIRIGGERPWDIAVHERSLFRRVLRQGSLGLGESYVDGWWDCDALDAMFHRLLSAGLPQGLRNWPLVLGAIRARAFNLQRKSRAFVIGTRHYDIGNDLYAAMLDRRLAYSCGYWKRASSLDEAQEDKLDLICRKIGLAPGMRVLDIGCGWGAFVKYAAEKYRVQAVGTTVSKEQAALAAESCTGLPIEIRFADYRDLNERFDRIVSLGMIEHVGYRNYGTYMKIVHDCLADDGLFLLQTIGSLRSTVSSDPWIGKYIFPNSMLPSIRQLAEATEGLFVTEDLHNFGPDYDKTLMAWWRNFDDHWPQLRERYGEPFYRMWTYYLLSCAGSFRARWNQLWQIVYSKRGVPGGYAAIR